jgi:hypothetical protein
VHHYSQVSIEESTQKHQQFSQTVSSYRNVDEKANYTNLSAYVGLRSQKKKRKETQNVSETESATVIFVDA